MRTHLIAGVIGGLFALGCAQPSGSPAQSPEAPGRGAQQQGTTITTASAPLTAKLAALAELSQAGKVTPDRVIVKFAPTTSAADREAIIKDADLVLEERIAELGYDIYTLRGKRALGETLGLLWADARVAVAEPDYRVAANAISINPLDPLYGQQPNLSQIRMPEAWFVHPGNPRDTEIGPTIPDVSDVTIAILDTGFDFTHPDLSLDPSGDPRGDLIKVYGGIDLVNGDGDATDDNGHGTLMAGIAAALTDDTGNGGFATGVAGVSWNARIMPVKVLDENGLGDTYNSGRGIYHAVQTWQAARGNDPAPPFPIGTNGDTAFAQPYNARLVINMSYSVEVPNALGEPQFQRDAVNFAVNNGAVLVAAAGDSGKPVDDGFSTAYPAGHSAVIAVGAVDEINQPLLTSNRPKTTVALEAQRFLVAPGVNVLGTVPRSIGDYGVGNGSSVAAAQVSGIVALMWGFYPLLLGEDGLVPTILETANHDITGGVGIDAQTGYGLADAFAALEGTFEPRPTNAPIIVRAFSDPLVHNCIHFVALSKFRLQDPTEIPFVIDVDGNIQLINGGAAFSYRIGIDADDDGVLADTEVIAVDGSFFPNEILVAQLNDSTYVGRIFLVQGPDPAPACTGALSSLIQPPPTTGDLIIEVTGVPEDFAIDDTIPATVTASTTLTLTDFANS